MDALQITMNLLSIVGGSIALIVAVTQHKKLAVKIAAHFLIAVGTLVIIGYAMGVPQVYTIPSHGVGMALPTAIGFCVIGGVLLILSNGPLK